MSTRIVTFLLAGLAVGGLATVPSFAQGTMASDTAMVGGAAMYPSKNIIENAVNSKDHTTLVAAVKASGPIPRWTNSPLDKFPAGQIQCEETPMLVPTLPCMETVAVPGAPGGALRSSHPANAAMVTAAAMIPMRIFRTF
jgi:hypothetical protein